MTPKGPPFGEGGTPSAAVWYEGPPQLTLPRMSPRPVGPSASLLHTPRCGPSRLDSGWVAFFLEQLHKSPDAAERAPLPGGPKTPRIDPTNSSSSSSRDFLLRVLADEIMPQFLADPSVQHLASVLLQQQSSAAFEQVRGAPHPSLWGPPTLAATCAFEARQLLTSRGAPLQRCLLVRDPQALESELAKWERLMGPPHHQGGPPSLSSSGGPLSVWGWSASPSPPLGGPQGSPDDEGPMGPFSSVAGTPAGAPRDCRASPCSRRVAGGPLGLLGGPSVEAREQFVTPLGTADSPTLLQGPPDAADFESSTQAGNDCLRGSPQQAWERRPAEGAPLEPRKDVPAVPADAGASPMPAEGPSSAGSEEVTDVLSAVRAARDQRRLRAPPVLDAETEATIDAAFANFEKGMDLDVFRERIVGPLLGLGPFLAGPLFRRVDLDNSGVVTPEKLKTFWKGRLVLRSRDPSLSESFPLPPLPSYRAPYMEGAEGEETAPVPVIQRGSLINFMGALSTRSVDYIYPEDLRPWVLEVVECAPDMAFLLDPQSADYLERYGPYDHFYVFYYAFQELDEDEDFLLHRSDVCKYQGHSMSSFVEARLFSQVAHRFTCEKPQHVNFEDWIWFVLAYHEVTLPKSLRFWFDIFDVDGDGFLTDHELETAFEAQAERIRMRDGKSQTYKEFICQISDALGVSASAGFSCRDFLRSPVAAGFLVNCLVKCEVLRAFDEGEPVINFVQGTPIERSVLHNFTPFEIYAHSEYAAFTAQRFEEHLDFEGTQDGGLVEDSALSESDEV
ncbi:hypothetical protein Esti_003714 [Eimeria stiedai]